MSADGDVHGTGWRLWVFELAIDLTPALGAVPAPNDYPVEFHLEDQGALPADLTFTVRVLNGGVEILPIALVTVLQYETQEVTVQVRVHDGTGAPTLTVGDVPFGMDGRIDFSTGVSEVPPTGSALYEATLLVDCSGYTPMPVSGEVLLHAANAAHEDDEAFTLTVEWAGPELVVVGSPFEVVNGTSVTLEDAFVVTVHDGTGLPPDFSAIDSDPDGLDSPRARVAGLETADGSVWYADLVLDLTDAPDSGLYNLTVSASDWGDLGDEQAFQVKVLCENMDDPCPELEGYDVSCNEKGYCEYARQGGSPFDVYICIPEGTFSMGRPAGESGTGAETPTHDVTFDDDDPTTLCGYFINRFEVTTQAYAAFLQVGADDVPPVPPEDRNTCPAGGTTAQCSYAGGTTGAATGATLALSNGTFAPKPTYCVAPDPNTPGSWLTGQSCAQQPANAISWAGAIAYCEWYGEQVAPGGWTGGYQARLCNESEWELAASGYLHRQWPWDPDPTLASPDGDPIAPITQDFPRANCAVASCYGAPAYPGKPAPVGTYPEGASPFGCEDMAGNVREWAADSWHGDYDVNNDGVVDEDPQVGDHPLDGSTWTVDGDLPTANHPWRGGGYTDPATSLRTAYRASMAGNFTAQSATKPYFGFRCCLTTLP